MNDAISDLKYAARLFARQPAILLLTIVGLSLGLGIATSAFTIMNAAVLRGDGLVDSASAPGVVRTTERSQSTVWTYDEFVRLREGATHLRVEALLSGTTAARTDRNAPAASTGVSFVSGGFFSATGARIVHGRGLEAADERHTGPAPAVISYQFWTSRLNRDPAIVGRTVVVGDADVTIVGVADAAFAVPRHAKLWMPITAYGAVHNMTTGQRTPDNGIEVFGRLPPGATLAEAEAQLSGVAAAMPSAPGEGPISVRLDSRTGLGRAQMSDTLAIALAVFIVIGLVLLLACANVSTVLISSAITRQREMGVRAALGASQRRIVRQLVTESLALGTIAAALGMLFAMWATPVIARLIEAPPDANLAPDLTVYLFLGVVTIVGGAGAGLAPAWHSRGADLVSPLKGDGARQNRVAPRRLRSLLVTTQAAVAVLLIILATLFVRATFRAASIDVGFESANLYAVSSGLGNIADDHGGRLKGLWARAVPELQSLPGVVSVTVADRTPFSGITKMAITRETPSRSVDFTGTRADFFDTMGLRLLAGRTYTSDEADAVAPVAVVSQSLAQAYWPGESPIGQLLADEVPVPAFGDAPRPVVVGVISNAITARLHDRDTLAVYMPLGGEFERVAELVIRVAPGSAGVIDQVTQRLRAIEPLADLQIASIEARVQQEASRPRMLAMLTGLVGIIAIVLCVIGLYGLTASVVGQRTREMGVRAAMGAEPGDLLRLLMRDSLQPVVFGLAAGAALAFLASQLVAAAVFFGVSPQDPIAFSAAALVLFVAATLAVIVPTRRAAAVDPAAVLRQ